MDIHPITHLSEDPTNILGDTIYIFYNVMVRTFLMPFMYHIRLSVSQFILKIKKSDQTNLDLNIAIQVDQWM